MGGLHLRPPRSAAWRLGTWRPLVAIGFQALEERTGWLVFPSAYEPCTHLDDKPHSLPTPQKGSFLGVSVCERVPCVRVETGFSVGSVRGGRAGTGTAEPAAVTLQERTFPGERLQPQTPCVVGRQVEVYICYIVIWGERNHFFRSFLVTKLYFLRIIS